ncbi:carbamoyltransferase C-terminal domain-containing protein [Aestuariispira ectoiniformans]|uniref:carbamoyltransferase C-terminal domain-containing protein n=1 Tax=Aestuariispira ectoiniformans TaxID=2775080 RepID=UPI00223B265C|nr:carbamoyltransferase C-terminal domain-containing protein [Aestuariispira ectoiniformans]
MIDKRNPVILSIHTGGHDAAAAVFQGQTLVSAIQLERLTRKKGDGNRFPDEAIEEVLSIAGMARKDVDVLLCSRMGFPAQYFTHWSAPKKAEYELRAKLGNPRIKHISGEMQRSKTVDLSAIFNKGRFLTENGFRADAVMDFYNHHYAHAYSALAYTDWQDAMLYTADAGGDNVHWSQHVLKDGRLTHNHGVEEEIYKEKRIDSVGFAYSFMTAALGYRMSRHEGKLTGLAAYGKPVLAEKIGRRFTVDEDGSVTSDFTDFADMRDFITELAKTVSPEDAAASIQEVLEDKILTSVSRMIKRSGSRNLGLAGGVFANVRLNRLLAESLDIDEIFVFPGMGDEGICVGGVHQWLAEQNGLAAWLEGRRRLDDVYLARDFNLEIDDVLVGHDSVTRISDEPVSASSRLINAGWVGAIYNGRMEFGPRALGARSIIASPADNSINGSLNDRLQRTEFMPFAPYVLEEDAREVFEICDKTAYACRFMTITCEVKEYWRDKIPAVVHVDGTARPQVVRRQENALYYDILKDFKAVSGLPVLVNTSFNAHEEPIINRPEECLNALLHNRVDFIVTQGGVYALRERAATLAVS